MDKVAIIGIRGLPAKYGAFDQFVDQFVKYSNHKKSNINFYISSDKKNKKNIKKIENVKQIFFYRGTGISILINYFFSILNFYFRGVRTFLFFGYGAVIFFPILKILNCKIICNVDGIEWRRKVSSLKKFYFKFCEKLISIVGVNIIFDSKVVERYYSFHFKVKGSLIYYPSDFSDKVFFKEKNTINKVFTKAIIVMRFVPENNIEIIVNAFVELNKKYNLDHKLFIIGASNEFFEKKIKPNIKNIKNIIYIGPVYNREKLLRFWSSADYYIHGHSVGGTNPTLIEAISLKKPVIAFNCLFNKIILGKERFYFRTEKELVNIIEKGEFFKFNSQINLKYFSKEYINESYLNLIKKDEK